MSKTVHTIENLPSRGYNLPLDVPRKLLLRGMLVSDYQSLLMNTEKNTSYNRHKGIELLNNVITDEHGKSVDLSEYYLPDIEYLLFELKKITFGIIHHQNCTCPHCNQNMNVDIDTDEYVDVKYLPTLKEMESILDNNENVDEVLQQNELLFMKETSDLVYKTFETDNYKIKIKLMTVKENKRIYDDVDEEIKPIKNLEQKARQKAVLTMTYTTAAHIVSVSKKITNNQYEDIDISQNLFKYEFIKTLGFGDYKKISDEIDSFYNTLGVNKNNITVGCPSCSQEFVTDLNLYADLFL